MIPTYNYTHILIYYEQRELIFIIWNQVSKLFWNIVKIKSSM